MVTHSVCSLKVLGLADFTGEMMRYAINIVTTGNYDQAMEICRFLRELSTGKVSFVD